MNGQEDHPHVPQGLFTPPRPPQRRPRDPSPETIDPSGRVEIPDDPNIASGPGLVGEQILAEAFPHLPEPINRDPRDLDQPLVPPQRQPPAPNSSDNRQGGAPQKTLSFSNPKKGNFSYRRRKPDINFLQQVLSEL